MWFMLAGLAISMVSMAAQAEASEQAGKDKQSLLQREAKKRMAVASHEMAQQYRLAERVLDRATAVAASQGGGMNDPTMINIMAELDSETEYQAMQALYRGREDADTLIYNGQIARNEGDAAKKASYIGMANTAISGMSSFQERGGFARNPAPVSSSQVGTTTYTYSGFGGLDFVQSVPSKR